MRRFIPKTFVAFLAAGLLLAPAAWSRDRGSSQRQSPAGPYSNNQEMLQDQGGSPTPGQPQRQGNAPARYDERKRPIPAGMARPMGQDGVVPAGQPPFAGEAPRQSPALRYQNGVRQDEQGRDIPPQTVQPNVVRPQGVRPVDVRPQGVRPVDVRPQGVRPVDVRPQGARPVDVRPQGARPDGVRHEGVRPGVVRPQDVPRHTVSPGRFPGNSTRYPDRVIHRPPPGYTTVRHHHDVYQYHSGRFYRPVSNGFLLVAPPLGLVVPFLPIGFQTILTGGLTFCLFADTWYRPVSSGYEVVAPPSIVIQQPLAPVYQQELWAPGATVSVDIDMLNVRSGPGKQYGVIQMIHRGTYLEIQQRSADWLYVRLPNGEIGWVMIQYTVPVMNSSNG